MRQQIIPRRQPWGTELDGLLRISCMSRRGTSFDHLGAEPTTTTLRTPAALTDPIVVSSMAASDGPRVLNKSSHTADKTTTSGLRAFTRSMFASLIERQAGRSATCSPRIGAHKDAVYCASRTPDWACSTRNPGKRSAAWESPQTNTSGSIKCPLSGSRQSELNDDAHCSGRSMQVPSR